MFTSRNEVPLCLQGQSSSPGSQLCRVADEQLYFDVPESLDVLLGSGHISGWGQDMMGIVAGSTKMEPPIGHMGLILEQTAPVLFWSIHLLVSSTFL